MFPFDDVIMFVLYAQGPQDLLNDATHSKSGPDKMNAL